MVLTFLLLLSIPAAFSQDLPAIVIQPPHTDVDPAGESFSIEVWLNVSQANVTELYGWQIKMGYNTTMLNATDSGLAAGHPLEGKATSFSKSIEDADGYILIMCSLLNIGDVVNVTVSKPMCYINFTTTANGNSILEQQSIGITGGTYMLNSTGQKIPFEAFDGDVTVIPEFMPFVALMFTITATATLVLLKKRWINIPK